MKKLIENVIRNRKIVLFLTLIVTVLGIYSYYLLPKQESPDVSAPIAMIITPYPGASPTDVKDLVTKKVEDKLVELDGYDYCKGITQESVSVVVVWFKSNTNNDKAMQDVRNAVADVQTELPKGTMPSQVNTDLVKAAGIIISLSGEHYSYSQLESFGEQFKERLQNISGISKAKIVGKIDKEVKVNVDISKLNQLELSMEDVCKVLAAQNIQIPSGNIEYKDSKLTVNIPGNYSSIDDVKNIIISVSRETGVVTRLKDIADVYMDVQDSVQKYKEDGKNAVLLTGYFEDNKNVVIIGKDVRKAIEEVKATLPEDLSVNEVVYQPDAVSSSTNEFMLHLLIGIVLVIVVVFLGMGVRNAIVVSTAIPLSILMTFIAMYLNNVQIHQISLTALIIALGILVDNAIVVCDTIQVSLNEGEDRVKAALTGTVRCIVPIFAATVAIIIAFSPLMGIPDQAGQFVSAIPWVLVVSIIASYIVAMFIIPPMMAYVGKKEKEEHEKKESKIRGFFSKTLKKCLRWKKSTIGIALIALVLTIVILMPRLPSQFFPYVDKDILYIDINSEKVADLDATEKLADTVESILKKEPEVESCTASIGTGMPKFYITMDPPKPSDSYAQMVVKFDLKKGKRFENISAFSNQLQSQLDKNISEGKCKVRLLEYAEPAEAKVIVRVSGKSLGRLIEVSNALQGELAKLPGTSDVRDNWNDSTLQLQANLDEDKASNLGILKYDVQKEVNIALYGYNASIYRKDGKEYGIKVKGNISDTSALENFKIKSSITGSKIPMKEFASFGYGNKLDTINTYKREQAIEVLADPLPGYDASDLEDQIEKNILPKMDTTGTTITFSGERESIQKTFTIIGVLAAIAIFFIYVVLMIQFKSFIQPVVILSTIPLSLIGSITGLFCLGQPLSLTAFLGIIALIGLVVKNGILLIDYINDARKAGHSIDEACIDAVDKRFNAIILSALTVVLALIPLALSGSSLFVPMAVSLMAGLAVSTFLTMIVIPVIYSVIETFMEKRKQGKMLKAEAVNKETTKEEKKEKMEEKK